MAASPRGPALDPAQLIAQRRRESDSFTALKKRTTTAAAFVQAPRLGALYSSTSPAATRIFPHHSRLAPSPRRVSNENKHHPSLTSSDDDDQGCTHNHLSAVPQLVTPGKAENNHSTSAPLSPRRTSASFTAVRENGYVSSSPFKATASRRPAPTMGLGPPPQLLHTSTPPRPLSPASALSPTRRGAAKGPRSPPATTTPPRAKQHPSSSGDETETEDHPRSTTPTRHRTTPGVPKTVTWAAEEEVLEFDVESDNSLLTASVISDGSRDSSTELDPAGDGSIVIIDDSVDGTDTESIISTMADEMLDEIDGALEANRSPRHSTPDRFDDGAYRSELVDFDQQPTNFHRHSPRDGYAIFSPSTVSTYLAAASPALSSSSNNYRNDNGSNSSYDEEEEEAIARKVQERKETERLARAQIVAKAKTHEPFRPTPSPRRAEPSSPHKFLPTTLPIIPSIASASEPHPIRSSFPSASYSSSLAPSPAKSASTNIPYSLPALEENSPFLGFGLADLSTVSSSKDYYTTSTFSAPLKSPAALTQVADLDRSGSVVSRHASILDTSTCSTYSSGSGSVSGSISTVNTSTAPSTRPVSELGVDVFGGGSRPASAAGSPVKSPATRIGSTSSGSYEPLAFTSNRIRAIPARPALNAMSTSETVKPPSSSNVLLPSLLANATTPTESSKVVVPPRMVGQESALDKLSKSMRNPVEDVRVVATPRRRRSRSTGDERSVSITQNRFSFLEPSIDEGDSFAAGMQTHQNEIFRQRGIIEHNTVYATDRVVSSSSAHSSGDVIAGKAWKKKRASDVHGTTMGKAAKGIEPAGKVFVTIVSVELPNLPLPHERTMVECVVKRTGPCVLGSFPLGSTIPISKQIELTYSPNLDFTFEVTINTRTVANVHLAPSNILPATPSLKGKSSFSRLKHLVSPSKKPKPVAAPTPIILQYTDLDKHSGTGTLASAHIDFNKDAAGSKNRVVHLTFPLHSAASHASSSSTPNYLSSAINKPLPSGAKLNLKFFYLPAIEGIDGRDMPRSVKECIEGIASAEKQAVMTKEGSLTQVGGDCDTWRERDFTLRGNRFIPRSRITKKAHIEFDLALALSLTDLNNLKVYDDTNPYRADRSFKITFKDGNEVFFFAATDREKEEWMTALRTVIGGGGAMKAGSVPEWAAAFIKSRDS